MITQDFTTVAKPKHYTFDLETEVGAFYRDHPAQKDRLFFIEGSTVPGALYRGGLPDEDEVAARLGRSSDVFENNRQAYESGSRSDFYPAQGFGTVILNFARKSQQNFLGYTVSPEVSNVFIFDHETGHQLCNNGFSDVAECAADAYAVLRHIQRFGRESVAVQRLIDKRAVELVLGDGAAHFTAPMVEKILSDSTTVDFSALTPQATVRLAERYAAENAPDPAATKNMAQSFRILQAGFEELLKGDFSVIKYLAEIVNVTADENVAKWGAVALRALVAGDMNVCGERLPKPAGREWVRLAKQVTPQPVQKYVVPRI